MRKTILILCLSAVTLVLGCRSGPEYHISRRKISIDTNPSGAKVYQVGPLSGEELFLGTTPLREQSVAVLESVEGGASERGVESIISQLEMVRVRIKRDGFKKYESSLWTLDDETVKHTVNLEPIQ